MNQYELILIRTGLLKCQCIYLLFILFFSFRYTHSTIHPNEDAMKQHTVPYTHGSIDPDQ
jgi:hypothetical protein